MVSNHAKRTQFAPRTGRRGRSWSRSCRTDPVPVGPGGARLEGRATRGECAKRSQFARRCRGQATLAPPASPRHADCAEQSQTWVGWDIWGCVRETYGAKTKPIARRRRAGRGLAAVGRGANAQNEANLPGRPGGWGRPIMSNKANFRRRERPGARFYKQTQLAGGKGAKRTVRQAKLAPSSRFGTCPAKGQPTGRNRNRRIRR